MKKLMFAAMIVSALSGYAKKDEVLDVKAAQVYDLNVSVIATTGTPGKCVFCGEGEEGEEGSVDLAEAWDFCPCEEYANVDLTAISGTWTLKFNSKLSKKLENTADITEVYSFPESVKSPSNDEDNRGSR